MIILVILCLIISIIYLILPEPDIKKTLHNSFIPDIINSLKNQFKNVWNARGYVDGDDNWEEPTLISNLLTSDECKELIEISSSKFTRSSVVGPEMESTRTSETAWIDRDHPIAKKILEKACELSGSVFENCEELQVVRYIPGTYYKPHHDSCCDGTEGCKWFEETGGGQRIGTLIIYLNEDFKEGYTHFPNFDKIFRAPPGSGIFFRPMDRDQKSCHHKAYHGGMPPVDGTKYICNAWVRENKVIIQ